MAETTYTYTFAVYPSETWGFTKSLYDFFRLYNHRVEVTMTKDQFERFRSEMGHDGFTLREIERWPYHPPEPVS